MRSLKKFLFYVLAFFVSCVIAFIIFETSFRLCGTVWKHIYRNTLDDGAFYVYVIGGSTALGQPYSPKISYPQILSTMFEDGLDGRPIKVINLAASGRSIEYGYWQLLRELYVRPHRHGVILVYAGINEIMNSLDRGVRYHLWALTQKSLLSARLADIIEEKYRWRSSVERYGVRLKRLHSLSTHYELPMVVSTLVRNIFDYPPLEPITFMPEEKAFVDSLSTAYFDEEFAKGVRLFEAKEDFSYSEKIYGFYYAARCYYALGRFEKAYTYLWNSLQRNVSRKPWPRTNEIIREFAAHYSCPLADTQQAFEERSPHQILDGSLFIDRCHPNIEGYSILAQSFAEVLVQDLSLADGYRVFSVEEIIEKTQFSTRDQIEAYLTRFFWDTYELLLLPPENAEARIYYENAKKTLAKAEALGLKDEERHLTRLILAVIDRDSDSVVAQLRQLQSAENKIFHIGWWQNIMKQRLRELVPEDERHLIGKIVWRA